MHIRMGSLLNNFNLNINIQYDFYLHVPLRDAMYPSKSVHDMSFLIVYIYSIVLLLSALVLSCNALQKIIWVLIIHAR